MVKKVILYMRKPCPLCDDAKTWLTILQQEYSFVIEERNIETNDEWLEKYQLMIPVIEIGGVTLHAEQLNLASLENALKPFVNEGK
ncbi:MAG TPA: glutaredoxin family protein [Bacillota bacterium]